jgi:hypothetical protein
MSGRENDGLGFPLIRKPFLTEDLRRTMAHHTGLCLIPAPRDMLEPIASAGVGMCEVRWMSRFFRQYVKTLSPYTCLFLLAVPTAMVEPLKVLGFFEIGTGHLVAGLAIMTGAYAVSAMILSHLFNLVHPRLLKLVWFKTGWRWFVRKRQKASQFVDRHGVT